MFYKWIIFLLINRIIHQTRFRIRRSFCKFFTFAYAFFNSSVYGIQLFLGSIFFGKNDFFYLGNRVNFSVFLNLIFGSVMLCIGHRVSAISVSFHFNKRRAPSLSSQAYGFIHGFRNRYWIHTVTGLTRHVIS